MFDFLEGILFELKEIPGLRFLSRFHAMLMLKNSRLRSRVADMKNRGRHLAAYTKKVRRLNRASKGAKRRDD